MSEDKSEKRWPCENVGNDVLPCYALEMSLEMGGQGTRRQGLKSISLINFETNKQRNAVSLISGDLGKRGAQINYCPFCGTNIQTQMKDD